jgi:hypothetical protein
MRGLAFNFCLSSFVALLFAAQVEAATQVRVAHLSPDAPPVDVYVDGTVVLQNVAFQAVSGYLGLDAGSHRVEVTAAGERESVVIDATLELESGNAYTVAATGLFTEGDLKPIVTVDQVQTLGDMARVRFNHTSPDAPPVDIAVTGGDVIFPGVAFRQSSNYLDLPAATYDLEVRLAGTDTVVLPLPGIALAAGTNYDVFAIGLVGDSTLAALPVVTAEPSIEPAQVRVAHLSPDAPPVDVWVDGTVVLENVPFKAVSSYLSLEAGTYNVKVTPSGSDSPVVIDADLDLAAGIDYTVAATGLLGQDDLKPLVLIDDRVADSGKAKVRFVHTSPDAPPVDVALQGGAVLFPGASFRDATEYLPVDPGTYDLEVRVADTETVALPLPGVVLEAGVNITVFAIGLVEDESLGALPTVDISERFIRGDANLSQRVNIADPAATLRYVFIATPASFCPDAADANDDGHVNIADAIYSLDFLFRGGAVPPAPFPEPNLDPTSDSLSCGL